MAAAWAAARIRRTDPPANMAALFSEMELGAEKRTVMHHRAPDPMKIMVACLHHCWRRDDLQRTRSPAPMLHSFSRDNFVRSMRSMRSMGSMEAPTDRPGPDYQRNPAEPPKTSSIAPNEPSEPPALESRRTNPDPRFERGLRSENRHRPTEAPVRQIRANRRRDGLTVERPESRSMLASRGTRSPRRPRPGRCSHRGSWGRPDGARRWPR